MEVGQALYFLRELMVRFQRNAAGPGDRALYEQGKLALHAVFEAAHMPMPLPEDIQYWREYVEKIWQQNEPATADYAGYVRETVEQTETPYLECIARAEEVKGLCMQLGSSSYADNCAYAIRTYEKAEEFQAWMQRNKRVTLKMEVALQHMLDGVQFRLHDKQTVTVPPEEEQTPF